MNLATIAIDVDRSTLRDM